MTAFRQVVGQLQQGEREKAMIGLEFVLRLDPNFGPAKNLQHQLGSGSAEIDLTGIIGELQAPTTDAINTLLVEAVDRFNQRQFVEAKEMVEEVLRDLPGHQDGRQLMAQIQEALKVEAQVGQFLAQARQAMEQGDPQEAANFVMMAQALDPHNPGINPALEQIHSAGAAMMDAPPQAPAPDAGPGFEPGGEGSEADFGFGFEDSGFEAEAGGGEFGASFGDGSGEEAGFAIGGGEEFGAAPDAAGDAGWEAPAEGAAEAGGDMWEAPAEGEAEAGGMWDAPAAEPGPASDMWEAPSAGDFSFDAPPQEAEADMFDSGQEMGGAALFGDGVGGAEPSGEDAERIQQLLDRGAAAFDGGDFQEAIDLWSRIFLIDPSHHEASQRVDEARQRKDEIDRQVEHKLYDAQDAAGGGDIARAVALVDEILALQPNHIEAVELRERLAAESGGSAAAAPPAAPAADGLQGLGNAMPAGLPMADLPDLDDDLFGADLPDVDSNLIQEAAPAAPLPVAEPKRKGLPVKIVVLAAAGLAVILLGGWLGSKLISSDGDDETEQLNRVLATAEQLAQQNKLDEAIHLLQEYPATGLSQTRIANRIERYQNQLHPTPTPIPAALTSAEELLQQGKLLGAYGVVERGLAENPLDDSLLDLKDRIRRAEQLVPNLYSAINSGNHRAVVSIGQELVSRHPNQTEYIEAYERALFNAALLELRAYNLAGGEVHLSTLARRSPDDVEVRRVLEFVEAYKARPVDMRLKVFISNLKPR